VRLTGDFERKIRFYHVTLFIGESKRYIKEGSGNRLSLHRGAHWETWKGACFTDFKKQMEGSGNASLSMGALGQEPERRAALLGKLKDT
jgi:hypothetical protein